MARYPAMSAARLQMLRQPGHLYAARSRYCDWIKIGFTSKPPRERLQACEIQYPDFAPFSLMGAVRSTWDAEQQLHNTLAPFRQRQKGRTRELYPAVPSLVRAITTILSNADWLPLGLQENREVREWAYRLAGHPANREPALDSYNLLRRTAA